jgi:acetoin:2,6-dichlorophenolindophenol oxidoreductase subunit alpha
MTAATTDAAGLDTPDLHRAHEQIRALRRFEERIERHATSGRLRGSTHLAIGQEAVPVGTRLALADGDVVAPTYRGHTWALAWGIPLEAAFAEMFGRATGCNGGRGGSKHLGSRAHGVIPSNAIVAAALPIACGAAWQARLDGVERVVVVPFGDGATNQAVFHEAMHLARIWNLGVLFVCENNLYSEMTPISAMSPFVDMADRAAGYDMPAVIVDGMDVEAVAAAMVEPARRARAGEGPTFIEAKTYRYCGHMPGDTEPYRDAEEIERWRERDPLASVMARLVAAGVPEAEVLERAEAVEADVERAEEAALAAAEPPVSDIALGAADWMEAVR